MLLEGGPVILKALFSLFLTVVEFLFGLLPAGPAAPDLEDAVDALDPLWNGFGWLNQYVPVDVALALLGVLLGSWAVMHAVNLTIWVLTKLHILGGSSV